MEKRTEGTSGSKKRQVMKKATEGKGPKSQKKVSSKAKEVASFEITESLIMKSPIHTSPLKTNVSGNTPSEHGNAGERDYRGARGERQHKSWSSYGSER